MNRRYIYNSIFYWGIMVGLLMLNHIAYARYEEKGYNQDEILYFNEISSSLDSARPFIYINTSFENASPLNWELSHDGTVIIDLVYDQQRFSRNKSVSHRYFQLFAKPGSDVKLLIRKPINIYKGRIAPTISPKTVCYVSTDGKKWNAIPTEVTKDTSLKVNVHMQGNSMYVAEIVPYSVSDLIIFQSEIEGNSLIKITPIGKTVEGKPLEIIQVGSPDAPYRIFIRGRAHAYESGGNWLIQGLVRRLLEKDPQVEKLLKKYCLYILSMANRDGVARGKSRYNSGGMDLNRNWNKLADSSLSPENYYLELWIKSMVNKGMKPDLAIDFHNDGWGGLHISRPPGIDLTQYLSQMKKFETLLHRYTWYKAGSTGPGFRDAGSMCEGLLSRYGITGVTLELNCLWVESLNKSPVGQDWELLGRQFTKVFFQYFD